jgi:hypothetical protein
MAKRKKHGPEQQLYPAVERWVKRHFACFKTSSNKGLRHGRIDVIGVRDVGGDLSGAIETIGIEVKRGSFPFANACGQTLGYKVYVNRAYLADLRNEGFTRDEVQIASNLGIGLVQIRNRKCTEVLSSPFYDPIENLNLRLLESLRLGRCQLCSSFFETGDSKNSSNKFGFVSREDLKRAFDYEKGLMFWNHEVAKRKARLKLRVASDGSTYERRFICPDCTNSVLSQFRLYGEKEDA